MTNADIINGLKSAETDISYQNKIWSKYSGDKADIGAEIAKVFKRLHSINNMRTLSIGCGYEPQLKILNAFCNDKLYLLDIDQNALDSIQERLSQQFIKNVILLRENFRIFLDADQTKNFLDTKLDGKRIDAIFLHHSLYYCEMSEWNKIIQNLFDIILNHGGAIHCVLMACKSDNHLTTTWLYNHFAGRFCNHHNNQNILKFGNQLKKDSLKFKNADITTKTTQVKFFIDDFKRFMAVIWMILLYPSVHQYSDDQKKEIIQHIYNKFFLSKNALIQNQNHLLIYKNPSNTVGENDKRRATNKISTGHK